ncbi:MAG TPA: Sec-independent protein translocase protein TatB [Caulobacteraceae bacterium]|nr:Sec-independent protein translocase protein TatB [Caulobacteraceae bacterium]
MLPGIGGLELVVIAIVALVVVGPKDLPLLMRKIGQFMNRLRSMANDFRASFDEMARQSELDDLRKEVEALRNSQMQPIADDIAAPLRDIETDLRNHPAPAWTPEDLSPVEEPDRFPHVDPEPAPARKARKPRATKAAAATTAKPAAKPRKAAAEPASAPKAARKAAAKPAKPRKPA